MRGVDVKRKRDYSKQIEYQRRYYAKCRAAKAKSCAYCGTEFIPSRGVGFRYCSAEHSAQAKKDRDNARPAPSPEDRKRWNEAWRAKNPDRARELANNSRRRIRAEKGREDRTTEYIARAAKKGLVYRSLEQRRNDAAAKEAARKLTTEQSKAMRKAEIAALKAARPSEAEEWRHRYRTDDAFRQKEIQRLKAQKLKRKKAMASGLNAKQTLSLYAERSTCLYCGCALSEREKVLEHMDPLARGGAHEAHNLTVACRKCNTRKSGKPFAAWLKMVVAERQTLVANEYARKRCGVDTLSLIVTGPVRYAT